MVSSLPLVLGFSSDLVFQKMCLSHALASFPEGTLLVTEPLLACWWLQEGCFPLFSFSLGLTQSSCSWIFRGTFTSAVVVGRHLMVGTQNSFQPLPQWLYSIWYVFFSSFCSLPVCIQTFYLCLCKQCIIFLAKFDDLCFVLRPFAL